MISNAERMIAVLSPEIDRKCVELQEARREKRNTGVFVLLCIMAILVPTLFVIFGLSLTTLLVPVIFTAVAFLILSPILINQTQQEQGGRTCEQI